MSNYVIKNDDEISDLHDDLDIDKTYESLRQQFPFIQQKELHAIKRDKECAEYHKKNRHKYIYKKAHAISRV